MGETGLRQRVRTCFSGKVRARFACVEKEILLPRYAVSSF